VFPVKDDIPTDRVPIVTLALIAANVVCFLVVGAGAAAHHGLVPDHPTAATALSSMFLHTGWLHLLGNVLFLWWFGPTVEDATGRLRFLALYVAGGLVAGFAQVAIDPSSAVPLVGASGAISAVMGAYLRLYPWARMLSFVFVVYFFGAAAIPAAVLLVAWFALQVALGLVDPGAVAYAAHIGGFLFGALVAPLVATRVKTPESLLRRGAAWS
jgi:membrane associated rhomboid family serine protease